MAEEFVPPANQAGGSLHPLLVETEDVSDDAAVSPADSSGMDEYHFAEISHPVQVLSGLNSLRQSGTFCDITICVDGEEFPSHRLVLAAFSPYFKAMFSSDLAESKQEKVTINGVDAAMIKLLLDYAYTSEVFINKSNVQSLLSAANLLQVLPVRDACCRLMEKNMDETNCLGIHCFAEAHACKDLQEKAKRFTLQFFPEVCQQEEFCKLSRSKLIEFLRDDNLCVEAEEIVFNAVQRWLSADPDSHTVDFHHVLEHVRLPQLNPYFLHDCVENNKLVLQSPDCQQLLDEAKTFHLLTDRRAELRSPRTRPRKASGRTIVNIFN